LALVFGANFPGCEEPEERGIARSGFHGGAAASFFTLHDADGRGYRHTGLARGFDGGNRGCTRGAYVVNDHHMRALLAKTFDSPRGAVFFFRFAH
jgi:hypothetical protein